MYLLKNTVVAICGSLAGGSIEEIDVERNNSNLEISGCSPRLLQEPEEPQYIYISSGEESVEEEVNIHQQGTCNILGVCRQCKLVVAMYGGVFMQETTMFRK